MASTLEGYNILVPAVIANYTLIPNGQDINYGITLGGVLYGVLAHYPTNTTPADAVFSNQTFELRFNLTASCTNLTLAQLKFQVTKGGALSPRGYVVKAKTGTAEEQLEAPTASTIMPQFTDVAVTIPSSHICKL